MNGYMKPNESRSIVREIMTEFTNDLGIEKLMRYIPLSEIIEKFWLERKNRKASSWTEHRNINMVMLATSLAPDGYLTL